MPLRRPQAADEGPRRKANCGVPGCRRGPRAHPWHPRPPVYDPEQMTHEELERAGITHLGGGWWQDEDSVFNSRPVSGPPPR